MSNLTPSPPAAPTTRRGRAAGGGDGSRRLEPTRRIGTTPKVVADASGRPVMTWEDRRATPRRLVVTRVELRDGDRAAVGITEDISEGGLFVASFDVRPVGTVLEVALTLPGHEDPIVARAEVVRVRDNRAAVAERIPGMGMRFVDLDDAARASIRAWVEPQSRG